MSRAVVLRNSVLAAAAALAIVGLVGSLRTGDLPGNGDHWSLAFQSIGLAALGLLVVQRRPDLPIGWLFLTGGLASAAAFTATWWAVETTIADPGSLPAGRLAAWATAWLPTLTIPLVFIAPLALFPNGRARSTRWRRFVIAVAAIVGVATAVAMVAAAPAAMSRHPESLLDVPGVPAKGTSSIALAAGSIARLAGDLGSLVAVIGVAWAATRARGSDRRAFRTVLVGPAIVIITFIAGALVSPLTDQRHKMPELVYSLAMLAIPGALAVAIARFRVYDIRASVSRTLLVAAATAGIGAVYFAVLAVLATVVGDPVDVTLPGMLAAGAVALVTMPLVNAARRATLSALGRASPGAVALRMRDSITADADAIEGLGALAGALRHELRLGRVVLNVEDLPVCEVGEGSTVDVSIPLEYAQANIGTVAVAARAGEALSATDLRTLRDAARYVAVAAHALRVSDQLRRAKHDLESAQSEERRRVRRDLHDGVAPTLASIRLRLGAVRRSTGTAALDEITDAVADALREIRRIVDGLQPSVLEDLGLVPAIEILIADVHQATGIAAHFDRPESLPALSSEVAQTAYRVVGEALANVVRHSHASQCTVRLWYADGMLQVTVHDDGHGFDTDAARGTGMQNMHKRAAMAGGSARIESSTGSGTTLTLQVPA